MYVIIVYDVEQERVGKVCKYLRRFLNWVQNSSFEGELTEAQLEHVKLGLQGIIDVRSDSVYIYRIPRAQRVQKSIMGQSKGPTDQFLE